jgi:hypothetical protein
MDCNYANDCQCAYSTSKRSYKSTKTLSRPEISNNVGHADREISPMANSVVSNDDLGRLSENENINITDQSPKQLMSISNALNRPNILVEKLSTTRIGPEGRERYIGASAEWSVGDLSFFTKGGMEAVNRIIGDQSFEDYGQILAAGAKYGHRCGVPAPLDISWQIEPRCLNHQYLYSKSFFPNSESVLTITLGYFMKFNG